VAQNGLKVLTIARYKVQFMRGIGPVINGQTEIFKKDLNCFKQTNVQTNAIYYYANKL
jgi:hypothetical protein